MKVQMKNIIKYYWTILRNKDIENFTDKKYVGKNVYNMKDFSKEMTFVHRTVKKLFLTPAIMFTQWLFKGKLKTKIDDDYQFRKVKVFDEAFERALIKWNTLFRTHVYATNAGPEVYMKDGATQRLRLIKEMYNTVLCGDTAYLEFHTFLMDEISKGMVKVDKNHVLYTSQSIIDNRYFMITDGIQKGVINLSEVK